MNTEAALIRQMTAAEAMNKKVDVLVKAVTDLALTVETLKTEIAELTQKIGAPVAALEATTDDEPADEDPVKAVYKRKPR